MHASSSAIVTVCRDSLTKKVAKNRGNTADTSISYYHCQHVATCLTATPRKLVEVANRKGNRCCCPPWVQSTSNTFAIGLHANFVYRQSQANTVTECVCVEHWWTRTPRATGSRLSKRVLWYEILMLVFMPSLLEDSWLSRNQCFFFLGGGVLLIL